MVTANLRVSIQDRPSAPGAPALVDGTLTAGSVQLAWSPADANGAAIEAYTVTGSGIRQDCPGSESSCVISGLTAGQPYVFVVTARNSVGESRPSAPSAAIVPDAAPDRPGGAVRAVRRPGPALGQLGGADRRFHPGDRDVGADPARTVRWSRSGTTSAARWCSTGLDPARRYQFQVRATNQQGISDWSAPSAADRAVRGAGGADRR